MPNKTHIFLSAARAHGAVTQIRGTIMVRPLTAITYGGDITFYALPPFPLSIALTEGFKLAYDLGYGLRQ